MGHTMIMFNVAKKRKDNGLFTHLFRTDYYSVNEAAPIQQELMARFKAPEYSITRVECVKTLNTKEITS